MKYQKIQLLLKLFNGQEITLQKSVSLQSVILAICFILASSI